MTSSGRPESEQGVAATSAAGADEPATGAHGDRLSLFATPVAVFDVADSDSLNHELCARLIRESQTTPGVRRSNAGGWHSTPDLAQRRDEPYRQVVRLIIDHIAQAGRELYALAERPLPGLRYGAQAWAMVMRDSDYTVLHEHGEAHWSSAYYADAGDADAARFPSSGLLAFVDPRRSGRSLPGLESGATFVVRPRTGMLVIFPGWLQHYVSPYRGTRPRVTISCNVTLEATEPSAADPANRAPQLAGPR